MRRHGGGSNRSTDRDGASAASLPVAAEPQPVVTHSPNGMDSREHRLVENETRFRDLNEQIEELASTHGIDEHVYEFLCECSNGDCTLRLPLTLAVYQLARARADQFIVAPGHDLPEIEHVVVRTASYEIVRKRGEAAEFAEEQDRRS
jgi:hypothetical protein